MTAVDRLTEMMQQLGSATAALDNMRGMVQDLVDDPLVAKIDPTLGDAQAEAAIALQHAEVATNHLQRLQERVQGCRVMRLRRRSRSTVAIERLRSLMERADRFIWHDSRSDAPLYALVGLIIVALVVDMASRSHLTLH